MVGQADEQCSSLRRRPAFPRRGDLWSPADMDAYRTGGRIVMRPYGADLRSPVGAIAESPVDMAALQMKIQKPEVGASGFCVR